MAAAAPALAEAPAVTVTYSANMTFKEACAILDRGESLSAVLMYASDGRTPINVPMYISRQYTDEIILTPIDDSSVYYIWTERGIVKKSKIG